MRSLKPAGKLMVGLQRDLQAPGHRGFGTGSRLRDIVELVREEVGPGRTGGYDLG